MPLTINNDVQRRLEDAAWKRLMRAADFFTEKLHQELNVSNPLETRRRKRASKLGKKGSRYSGRFSPSKPGEPPRKRTGWLQRHVKQERDRPNLRIRVGVSRNAIYGLFLELAKQPSRRRPWLEATLKKFRDQIKATAEVYGPAA